MKTYLVTANTYNGGYGLELTLFGVFLTKKEAIKWIMDNPVVNWISGTDPYGHETKETFDFFEFYEKDKERKIFEQQQGGRMICIGSRIQTKEEYAIQNYITCFNDHPVLLGCYVE